VNDVVLQDLLLNAMTMNWRLVSTKLRFTNAKKCYQLDINIMSWKILLIYHRISWIKFKVALHMWTKRK